MAIKLGEKILKDIYLGDKRIVKAYFGEKLVFEADKPIFVEWIESVHSAYIDTGIFIDSDCKVSIEVKTSNTTSNAMLYGVYYNNDACTINIGNASTRSRFGGASYVGNLFIDSTNKHTYTISKDGIQIDDTLRNWTEGSVGSFTGTTSTFFFGYNYGKETTQYFPVGTKVYDLKVYKADTLLQDLKPCLHPKTFEACMYDMVTGTYFYNQGTGEFKYGGLV